MSTIKLGSTVEFKYYVSEGHFYFERGTVVRLPLPPVNIGGIFYSRGKDLFLIECKKEDKTPTKMEVYLSAITKIIEEWIIYTNGFYLKALRPKTNSQNLRFI